MRQRSPYKLADGLKNIQIRVDLNQTVMNSFLSGHFRY